MKKLTNENKIISIDRHIIEARVFLQFIFNSNVGF